MNTFQVERVSIRYEGKDAASHKIDMMALGVSLQGFGRVYSTAAHFALTGKYVRQMQAMDVRAYADEAKQGCFEVPVFIQTLSQADVFSGLAGAIIGPLVAYIICKASNNRVEMKALKEILEQQLSDKAQHDAALTERLLDLVEKMADNLKPSVRQAVSPIGATCDRIDLAPRSEGTAFSIDQATKDAIMSDGEDDEITNQRSFRVTIVELDRERATAKIRLGDEEASESDEDPRVSAQITDPGFASPSNPYYRSLATNKPITVTAKAALRSGVIRTLYVSDAKD